MVTTFQSLCRSLDDDGKVTVSAARSIVLYKSNGLCPVNLFVNENGTLLSLNEVCSPQTYNVVEKKQWKLFGKNLEKFIDVAVEKENKARSNHSLKCVLGSGLELKILRLLLTHGENCKEFRAALLKIKNLKVRGIHFFRWDGTPRPLNEIKWAICHYPSSSMDMSNVLKVFGAAILASSLYAVSKYNQQRLSPKERLDILKRLELICLNDNDIVTLDAWNKVDDYSLKTIATILTSNKVVNVFSQGSTRRHCSLIQTLYRWINVKPSGPWRNPYTNQFFDEREVGAIKVAYKAFLQGKLRLTAEERHELSRLRTQEYT
jgi:hypothetical protein